MDRITDGYMNRCLAQDIDSSADLERLLGVDGMLYVMEYMEHGNFNVMLNRSPCSATTRALDWKSEIPLHIEPPIPRPKRTSLSKLNSQENANAHQLWYTGSRSQAVSRRSIPKKFRDVEDILLLLQGVCRSGLPRSMGPGHEPGQTRRADPGGVHTHERRPARECGGRPRGL